MTELTKLKIGFWLRYFISIEWAFSYLRKNKMKMSNSWINNQIVKN